MTAIGLKYTLEQRGGPIWSFAIHDGHHISEELLPLYALNSEERLREEDPYTGMLTKIDTNRLVVRTSRFQLDLNRDFENAVYLRPEQAWNLRVFKQQPNEEILGQLQKNYEHFYQMVELILENTIKQYGYFIVLDIHSYNAKRGGPQEIIDIAANPQLNLGTAHNDAKWTDAIQSAKNFLATREIDQAKIDVRENVKFSGGHLSQWINKRFSDFGFVLSLEFRKDFMDEWTGILDPAKIEGLRQLLADLAANLKSHLKPI